MWPKIVLAHNFYRQPGGEDEVFRAEATLLEERGHSVIRYEMRNSSISAMGRGALVRATLWNNAVYRELCQIFRDEAPDVVHFHNTFPIISPAAYYAARSMGVPVIQTLHNFRLICPNGLLFRDGRPCEQCVGRPVAWPGIVHSCYRGSLAATAVTAAMQTLHRALATWEEAVDVYIALTEFSRRKFIEGGIPPERIMVKANALTIDPGVGSHGGTFALFVGRLSPEKGLHTLIRAWQCLRNPPLLKVVGDGPLSEAFGQSQANVEYLGHLSKDRVFFLMKAAAFLIVPSDFYEMFPVTVLEAFATGLPVVATGHGSLAEIVIDGETGRLFRPGEADDLARVVQWCCDHPEALAAMSSRARAEYEAKYTAENNYDRLIRVYRAASVRSRIARGNQ